MSYEGLVSFFGYASALNISFLFLSFLCVRIFNRPIVAIHQWFFPLTKEELERQYFQFLALYEIITVALFVVPYIALRMAL